MFLLLAGLGGASGAAAQTSPVSLHQLADEYWEWYLQANPTEATSLGDRRYDDRLGDISAAGIARDRAALEAFLARARAIPTRELAEPERLTHLALVTELESGLAEIDCGLHEWVVDPLWGPQVYLLNIESQQPVRTVEEGRMMGKRWRAMGPYVDAHVENLRRGLAAEKAAVRAAVEKAIQQLRELRDLPLEEWALLNPLEVERPEWSEEDRAEFASELRTAVEESVRPAFVRYLEFLENEALPAARAAETPGVMHVAGGDECYRNLIRLHTSLSLSPDELHETGLAEVAKINGEMEELGAKVLGTKSRAETLERLRTDTDLYFTTREEVREKAETALARAKAAMPEWFGILPEADCVVTPMAPHEEKHSTIAYYRQPAIDGSRPGQYFINTYAPETRPRYEAEALAYHEAIPGHHLQIAISQELEGIPEFRKHTGVTAYVEGWALYTERLSNEMGLYSSDLDRIGMLSYDAWRACRLVVDTGMHAKGWTRHQAIEFMLENTALAENNIVNEVDRYITWPGQALAYKTGQLEILRLREEARRELGERFDIRAFHDAVLRNGAIALEPLREVVRAYVEKAKQEAASEADRKGDAG